VEQPKKKNGRFAECGKMLTGHGNWNKLPAKKPVSKSLKEMGGADKNIFCQGGQQGGFGSCHNQGKGKGWDMATIGVGGGHGFRENGTIKKKGGGKRNDWSRAWDHTKEED